MFFILVLVIFLHRFTVFISDLLLVMLLHCKDSFLIHFVVENIFSCTFFTAVFIMWDFITFLSFCLYLPLRFRDHNIGTWRRSWRSGYRYRKWTLLLKRNCLYFIYIGKGMNSTILPFIRVREQCNNLSK